MIREDKIATALFRHDPVAPLAANLKALPQVGRYVLYGRRFGSINCLSSSEIAGNSKIK
jgi:hypothetical protein